MKLSSTYITAIITVSISIILLVLQKPITDALMHKSNEIDSQFSKIYTIKNTYYLPQILNEVSGIAWLSENTFACVQDEDGFIYIYDVEQKKITTQTKFDYSGDYEGIAIHTNDAYVMRSDGLLYEIKNYLSKTPEITKIKTPFSKDNDIESLAFDRTNNCLLTAPKEDDFLGKDNKSIYQIPLSTKEIDTSEPFIKINLAADTFKKYRPKKIQKTLNPSGIAIHPITNDIYVLDGKKPKLLVLNSQGKILKLLPLDKRKFGQAEGITFSDDGRLFISNEATNGSANILEVELK